MLGYGGTSKPTDPNEYASNLLAQDLYEFADHEGIGAIIPTGHDWGAFVASRLYMWRPDRCAGLVLLSVAYQPPTPPGSFDLAAALDRMEQTDGYPRLEYWELFAAADGPALLGRHAEALFHLLHWDASAAAATVFCARGATQRLLLAAAADPQGLPALRPYARRPGFKAAFLARVARDGFAGPQCYYVAAARNVHSVAEAAIPAENIQVRVPCLYISSTGDAVCRTDGMEPVRHLVPDLQIHVVEANHWIPYEKPGEVRGHMADWLKSKYPGT